MKGIKIKSTGFHAWSGDEIERNRSHWPTGSRQRLAFALLRYTGQRRSDVVRMGPEAVAGSFIEVTQQKTGARLTIPIHPALKKELEAWKPNGTETFGNNLWPVFFG